MFYHSFFIHRVPNFRGTGEIFKHTYFIIVFYIIFTMNPLLYKETRIIHIRLNYLFVRFNSKALSFTVHIAVTT